MAKLNNVALKLIRHAAVLLAGGPDKMSRDAACADMAEVEVFEDFIAQILSDESGFQAAIWGQQPLALLAMRGKEVIAINRQNCATTWPNIDKETSSTPTAAPNNSNLLLEPTENFCDNMLSMIADQVEEVATQAIDNASCKFRRNFKAAMHHTLGLPVESLLAHVGTLAEAPPRNKSEMLREFYQRENLYGRSELHRRMIELEIVWLEQYTISFIKRRDWLTRKIQLHNKARAKAANRQQVAQKMFQEVQQL